MTAMKAKMMAMASMGRLLFKASHRGSGATVQAKAGRLPSNYGCEF
jgi:hypothetical protein